MSLESAVGVSAVPDLPDPAERLPAFLQDAEGERGPCAAEKGGDLRAFLTGDPQDLDRVVDGGGNGRDPDEIRLRFPDVGPDFVIVVKPGHGIINLYLKTGLLQFPCDIDKGKVGPATGGFDHPAVVGRGDQHYFVPVHAAGDSLRNLPALR